MADDPLYLLSAPPLPSYTRFSIHREGRCHSGVSREARGHNSPAGLNILETVSLALVPSRILLNMFCL